MSKQNSNINQDVSTKINLKLLQDGIRASIPTALGYWAVSFACGAVGVAAGFSILQVACLGVLLYAGSAQFLFYSLAIAGASPIEIGIGVAFINMRYLLINTYMSQFFKGASLWRKIVGGALVTDETFGVTTNQARNSSVPFSWLLGLNLSAWINWALASIAGACFASFLPDWIKESLGFSLVGMFIGLLVLSLQSSQTRAIDIIAIFIAILITGLLHDKFNANSIIILTTVITASISTIIYTFIKRLEK